MSKRQMSFMPHDKYIKNVLVGNWFENRCEFVKNPHDFKTNYFIDYSKKQGSSLNEFIWDQRFKWQGYGARIIFDHQAPHYLENYSTLYDLSYNHYPKKTDGPIPRELRFRFQRYEPEQDYAKNHGNITKYGLIPYFKEKWRCEVSDPRQTQTTCYQETFSWPKSERITTWGIPTPNSSIMYPANSSLCNFKLRNKQILVVPEDKLIQFPHEPKCNPITWECPSDMKTLRPCKGPPIERKRKQLKNV